MEQYIPQLHIIVGAAALLVYVIRGVMMLADNTTSRIMLALSSITTILLFASGVFMGFAKQLSFSDGFMATKLVGLLLFVGFGVVALKQGLSKPVASVLWLLGLAAFVYTYLIATHKLMPFFS